MAKLRILLADDHVAVREGLKAILNGQPDMTVVSEVADGAAATEASIALQPDLVLMDVSMPVVSGLKATATLKQHCPNVKVIVLTRHLDEAYVQRVFSAGASGYVLKQSRMTELLAAIRAVAAGGRYLDSHISITVKGVDLSAGIPSRLTDLRKREEQVLRLVAWGCSNKDIANHLKISVKTVEMHKSHAMRKLG